MRVKALPQTGVMLVCMGSDCKKCGSKKVCEELRTALKESGKSRNIRVQKVRCLGCCGKAPNVLSFPSGKLYSDVSTKDVENMLLDAK